MSAEQQTRKDIIDKALESAGWSVNDPTKVEKRDLIQSPFTIIHPQGIRGVFSPSEINDILKLTERLAA